MPTDFTVTVLSDLNSSANLQIAGCYISFASIKRVKVIDILFIGVRVHCVVQLFSITVVNVHHIHINCIYNVAKLSKYMKNHKFSHGS